MSGDNTASRAEITCAVCGTHFTIKQSHAHTRRFCSRSCYVASVHLRADDFETYFWKRVRKTPTCWEWTGIRGTAGLRYGIVRRPHDGIKDEVAHRTSWRMHFGEIPAGMFVCHHCDNPICVRPDHLFLGTQIDNMADMARKERQAHRKLTAEDVREIRRRHDSGESQSSIAADYPISRRSIGKVTQRLNWRHVE